MTQLIGFPQPLKSKCRSPMGVMIGPCFIKVQKCTNRRSCSRELLEKWMSSRFSGLQLLKAKRRELVLSFTAIKQATITSISDQIMIPIFALIRMSSNVPDIMSHSNVYKSWCVLYCRCCVWCAAPIITINFWSFSVKVWHIFWTLSVDTNQ